MTGDETRQLVKLIDTADAALLAARNAAGLPKGTITEDARGEAGDAYLAARAAVRDFETLHGPHGVDVALPAMGADEGPEVGAVPPVPSSDPGDVPSA